MRRACSTITKTTLTMVKPMEVKPHTHTKPERLSGIGFRGPRPWNFRQKTRRFKLQTLNSKLWLPKPLTFDSKPSEERPAAPDCCTGNEATLALLLRAFACARKWKFRNLGLSENQWFLVGGPWNKGYTILGSVFESPIRGHCRGVWKLAGLTLFPTKPQYIHF